MSRNATASIIIVLLILLGGFFYFKSHSVVSPVVAPEVTASPIGTMTTASPEATISQNIVTITSSGFSPAIITIKAGDSVTWINQDSENHQVDSDPHPVYTDYPPLNGVGLLTPSQQKSLQFPTPGTYHYHDHLNPEFKGTIVVE